MKIATYNVNSIRTRMKIILEWLEKEQPDLLCVQETKVQDKDFPVQSLAEKGYTAVFKGQKSYNGVAMISKTTLTDVRTDLYRGGDEQARFLSARINSLPVINVYVPQGFQVGSEKFEYKLRWLQDLLSHIMDNFDPGEPLLLAGDFNIAMSPIDLYDPVGFEGQVGFNEKEQAIMKEYFKWGFKDIFRLFEKGEKQYTFWDYRIPNGFKRNLGWRIDLILATKSMAARSRTSWIDLEPRRMDKPSDHTILIAEFNDYIEEGVNHVL